MPLPASATKSLHRVCRLQRHSAINLLHTSLVPSSYAFSRFVTPSCSLRHVNSASSLHASATFHASRTQAAASTSTAASVAAVSPSPALSPRPKRSRASPSRRRDSNASPAPSHSSSPSPAATRTSRRLAAAAASPQPLPSRSAAAVERNNRPHSVSASPAPASPPLFSVSFCSAARPHPDKSEGEDTHLLHSSAASTTAVVYDGVGSWSFEQGVDVAAFSQRMRDATAEALAVAPDLQPQQLMQAVWEAMDRDRIPGSSTACLLRIACQAEQAVLTAASVGDTGFLVLRRRVEGEKEEEAAQKESTGSSADCSPITAYSSALQPDADTADSADPPVPAAYYVHYRSLQQLHWFNCPYQLGFAYLPPASSSSSSSPSSSSSSSSASPPRSLSPAFDLPSTAVTTRLPLRPSDVVVLASDGLFDNLDEREITRIASATAFPSLASQLLEEAWSRSLDRSVDGPFAVAAKDNNICWAGGRKDDITVIALRVDSRAAETQQQLEQQRLPAGKRAATGRPQTAGVGQ